MHGPTCDSTKSRGVPDGRQLTQRTGRKLASKPRGNIALILDQLALEPALAPVSWTPVPLAEPVA
jgi:hypothetical protein